MIHCVVQTTLSGGVTSALRRALRDSEEISVVVERRTQERRSATDRRIAGAATWTGEERRRVTHVFGRRVADRRAMSVPVQGPNLPWRARRAGAGISFLTHVEVPEEYAAEIASARLAIRVQLGDRSALRDLYLAHFDCVFAFARTSLRSARLGEEAAQQTFVRAYERIAEYDPAAQPFRAWLFSILCEGLDPLGSAPAALEPIRDEVRGEFGLDALAWLDDDDLRVLLDRVPRPHRDVLLLRYMLGLAGSRVAQMLGCSPEREHGLHAAALRELEFVISDIGRVPRSLRRESMRRLPTAGLVVRRRQMALRG